MSAVTVKELTQDAHDKWLPLWIANNLGQYDEPVSDVTWQRLIDPDHPVFGLAAYEDDHLAGILHYVIHHVTGHIEPVCYMQDLFVDPAHRKKGIAREMVKTLAVVGQNEKWARIYWLADESNEAAQALYRTIGVKLGFSLHVLPLGSHGK